MSDKNVLWVSIDPGLNTGIAGWGGVELQSWHLLRESNRASQESPAVRVGLLCCGLDSVLSQYPNANRVYIEGVRSFTSARSWAASTRGNLALLAYIVGGYIHVCQERNLLVEIIDPKWKGQLPTRALESRITRAGVCGEAVYKEHVREAIGLGLSVTGRL